MMYSGIESSCCQKIAARVHDIAQVFQKAVQELGYETLSSESFFDTVCVKCDSKESLHSLLKRLEESRINVRVLDDRSICVSFDETHTKKELELLVDSFAGKSSAVDLQRILDSLPGKDDVQKDS
jgi:glycine dehydrogenase